jgi:hypothetical protein
MHGPSSSFWTNLTPFPLCQGMTAERVARLAALGFAWGSPTPAEAWERQFAKLQQYRAWHGNCDVLPGWTPDPALGSWVRTGAADARGSHGTPSWVLSIRDP